MKIASYVKPSPNMDYMEYLKSEMYDIYGGEITYIEDSPSHINHGSLKLDGSVILFNCPGISIARSWPWDYSGYTIDMWIKPISYGPNSFLISVSTYAIPARFWLPGWGTWNCSLNNINRKGIPNSQWSRVTICSDEDNKKLYGFVNGELQATIIGGNWKNPSFYIGGNDPWYGGGYCQLYLNEIYVTPKVRFTEEFDPYKNWMLDDHLIYTNPDVYGIRKKEG